MTLRIALFVFDDETRPPIALDYEELGREIIRNAGYTLQLSPADCRRVGFEFSNDLKEQVETWFRRHAGDDAELNGCAPQQGG